VEAGLKCEADATKVGELGPPTPLFPKLVPRRNASRKAVTAHQRARLHAAMIEACARHGYARTTARELAALAGVSTRSLYAHFGSKEACFFATYDLVVQQAMGRISDSYRGAAAGDERDRDGLCRAFEAFTAELLTRPAASRLALVEILAAPPEASGRIERTESQFATMISTSVAQAGDGPAIPPATLRALIGGIWFIARARLLQGHPEAIGAAGAELSEWLLVYRTAAGPHLAAARSAAASGVRGRKPCDATASVRGRLLHAAAEVVARGGYAALSPAHVADTAGVTEGAFESNFDDTGDCFLSILELLSAQALAEVLRESEGAATFAGGVCRAVETLFFRLAADEALARAAFLDVFVAGPEGAARHTAVMRGFAESLVRRAPATGRPTQLVAEAIVGAVWSIAHRHVARGRADLLPSAAPRATFVILAPILGADAALAAISDERSAASGQGQRAVALRAEKVE
jgi:AcrR family transcriptional regulator